MINSKKVTAIVLAVLCAGICLGGCDTRTTGSGSAVTIKQAPDFDLEKLGGGRIRLADYRGKIVIIDFWATWCPPCRKEIPDFVELYKEYAGKGVEILGISLDQKPRGVLPPFVEKYKINYPILLTDGKVDRAYGGVTGIPTTFVIDREGRVYKQYVGFRPREVFEEDITALLKQ
ncbi:MAG: TlpA disulfide reductase family protein [PVC group bacterium]